MLSIKLSYTRTKVIAAASPPPPSDVKSVWSGTGALALKLSLGWLINEYAARFQQDRKCASRFDKFSSHGLTLILGGGNGEVPSETVTSSQLSTAWPHGSIGAPQAPSLGVASQSWQIGGMHNKLSLIQPSFLPPFLPRVSSSPSAEPRRSDGNETNS